MVTDMEAKQRPERGHNQIHHTEGERERAGVTGADHFGLEKRKRKERKTRTQRRRKRLDQKEEQKVKEKERETAVVPQWRSYHGEQGRATHDHGAKGTDEAEVNRGGLLVANPDVKEDGGQEDHGVHRVTSNKVLLLNQRD